MGGIVRYTMMLLVYLTIAPRKHLRNHQLVDIAHSIRDDIIHMPFPQSLLLSYSQNTTYSQRSTKEETVLVLNENSSISQFSFDFLRLPFGLPSHTGCCSLCLSSKLRSLSLGLARQILSFALQILSFALCLASDFACRTLGFRGLHSRRRLDCLRRGF